MDDKEFHAWLDVGNAHAICLHTYHEILALENPGVIGLWLTPHDGAVLHEGVCKEHGAKIWAYVEEAS